MTPDPTTPTLPGLAIDRFLSHGESSPEAIDAFVEAHTFPLIEETSVTFVYRGLVDEVRLQHFIYGLETSQPFHRLGDSDFWHLTLELPQDSVLQYKLNIAHGEDHQWILDPLNPNKAHDPFGANSIVRTTGSKRPEWTLPHEETRAGDMVRVSLHSEAFDRERDVLLYLPARFRRTRRYPLLVVHDGHDYLRYSDLKTVLDNLIHRLEVAPMLVALTNAEERLEEYPDDPRHARFLTEELVPTLEKDWPLRGTPAARGLMGASFGGVASLSCAWRYPGFYGRLLLQSGSFAFTDIGPSRRGETFDPVVRFVNAFRQAPGRPSDRVFMSCGTYESLIYENRSMVPLLQQTGMEVKYVEARDGHNWVNWRDRLRTALPWLFPGPLWMVYE
ncbi:MAG: alpha/beta hydrolase-fold protein [Acidobacteriota bacterium]